eukprot:4938434-Pyramimonas_sp.AAC.3
MTSRVGQSFAMVAAPDITQGLDEHRLRAQVGALTHARLAKKEQVVDYCWARKRTEVRQEEGMRQQALLEAGTVWSALEEAELSRGTACTVQARESPKPL